MRLERPARATGKKIVVIVGGGFAGLNAAKQLANAPGVHVILVDQRNHHLFQPLLYQVATAGLNPADIAVPIRAQFRHVPNIDIHLGRVEGVILQQRVVFGGELEIGYDYLVLACGARHSYFGHTEWEDFAPGLKTLEQATEIRRRILSAFELAENEIDPDRQKAFLTFVVVGAGPTGVELAGAIADISRTAMRGDFRRIDPAQARVVLVEAGPRVLAFFSELLSERAKRDLVELGVEVWTGSQVERIDADGVTIGSQKLLAHSVFWAAGVEAARLRIQPPVETDRAGRIKVTGDFSVPGQPNVFVVGDMASFEIAPGKLLPGLAPAAIQGGRYAAAMILRDIDHQPRTLFSYRDKGQMATIGKSRAIAEKGRLALTGRAAWLAWLFVHVFYLIGFRNRTAVLAQWAWNYIF
ncbi:MAG: FAD-dependent oxidoreductase, partial [Acidobacteria bacterium]